MRTDDGALRGRRILVAASGSIAAVKTPLLVSGLVQAGAEVRCLLTPSAEHLVSPVAMATLSRHRCYRDQDQWDPGRSRPLHIELAEWAELMVVAPLSATTLGRWSQGLADGLLASTLLACERPVLAAAAMNTAMWKHPAVQANWQSIQRLPGVIPLSPTAGLLACDRHGDGRMADPIQIELAAAVLFSRHEGELSIDRSWLGRRLLVSAGSTLESIDQARLISNRSSGRMGVLLAQVARLRGADVELVHGPLQVPQAWLEGLDCESVESADQMQQALHRRQEQASALAMVAAVADLRRSGGGLLSKPPKSDLPQLLEQGWEPVPDLLEGLVNRRPSGQRILGFAALTGSDEELLLRGGEKRLRKGCDLLMVNPIDRVGEGFGEDNASGWLLGDGLQQRVPLTSKLALAHDLLDALAEGLATPSSC
ncbi:MAG: bifunctional phosphopantothenoylcysteine decarboxylase/phosphopantothenate--cysteine ligase CoaBC [Cyanobacteriota bacterium]|nr:bifunctional phosphopantothenoylcysteine decarboxylase/phosphopantothenate--cysteine ligase CoaBC [Cyanobacteriota bacterium]